jgi:hypothetical protein
MIYRLAKNFGYTMKQIEELTPTQQNFLITGMEEEQREIRQARRHKAG